jgi:hypothetical protein
MAVMHVQLRLIRNAGRRSIDAAEAPLRGFYRIKPVVVMSGKSIQGKPKRQKRLTRMLRSPLRR